MQFPESWLRAFCNPPLTSAELANLLTMSGMEVESQQPVAPPFNGVVVGSVVSIERHPNADRLNVCQVDAGTGGLLQIVCGAPNVRAGIKVPCALVGASLPPSEAGREPFAIKLGQLRGVESQGMLCSARELKLSDDAAGLLILADDAPIGLDLRDHLMLDDTLFTLKLTPNLGHALSVFGVARELAALTGSPLLAPDTSPVAPRTDATLSVDVAATDLCGRFSGRVVRGVNTGAATPAWMVDRLARCGQRSVSALVDISNYVMFESGQPTHIFDLDKIHGGLTVRWAAAGETLELLNGSTVQLDAQVGVIADDRAVESLAGIMGGMATSVGDATNNVYVEAAFWWPAAVAGRSRRYNFSTDAGHRFERGVDPSATVQQVERITRLIVDICGGEPGPVVDQVHSLPPLPPVRLRVERAAKVIGMPLTLEECAGVMTRLGFAIEVGEGVIDVTPPSWRFDLLIEEDLIEEVIRVIGYDKLPSTPPTAPVVGRVQPESRRAVHELRRSMAALGYFETVNFSFVEEKAERDLAGNVDPIRVLNPIASPLSVMRSGLMSSLVDVTRHNLARKASRVRVFEIGRVFKRDASVVDTASTVAGVRQPMRLAGLAYGPVDAPQWAAKERTVDFFDMKGDVESLLAPQQVDFIAAPHPALHPGRSARIDIGGRPAGFIGELHPRWRQSNDLPQAPILFEIDLDALLERPMPTFKPLPRQQSAWRDLALIVDESITHAALMQAVEADASGLVRAAHLFDIYKPAVPTPALAAGERSLAIRIELRDDDATLTDERIDTAVTHLIANLADRLGARLRG